MDPFTLALMTGASLAFQGGGMFFGQKGAKQNNEAQQKQFMLEQAIENEKRKQMELVSRRQQLEVVRNAQRMRALALQNSTSQGANQGSGLQGGYGQIASDANYNLLGLAQNLAIGRNIFGLNSQISENKKNMAEAQMTMQYGQGLTSIGQSLFSAAVPASRAATQLRPGQQSFPTYSQPSFNGGYIY